MRRRTRARIASSPMPSLPALLSLLLAAAVAGCASAPRASPAQALLGRAIAAAGGAEALGRAGRLRWEGDADVHAGGRDIALAVRSDIEPFGRIRAESWLRDAGPSTMRAMVFDGGAASIERDGHGEPMPEAMARNERAQYGSYALMLLAPLRDPGVELRPAAPDAAGHAGLEVRYPGLPPATLFFDAGARLVALENSVASPDGAGTIAQRFTFAGTIESNGVRWPRELHIAQDGKPFFDLRLRSFEALPAGGPR